MSPGKKYVPHNRLKCKSSSIQNIFTKQFIYVFEKDFKKVILKTETDYLI